jgi:hypothetical protein
VIDPDMENATQDVKRLMERIAKWVLLGLCGVCGVILLLWCTRPAQAANVTFTKVRACGVVAVSRRGEDVIIRCDGVLYLTITNQPLTCPSFRYVVDAQRNFVVYC